MAKKILIIEDSPTVCAMLKELFTEQGHEVIITENGEQGIEKAKNEKPDIIVIEGQGSLLNPAYPGGFEILAAGRRRRRDAVGLGGCRNRLRRLLGSVILHPGLPDQQHKKRKSYRK